MELYCYRIGVRGEKESEAVSRAEDWRCYGERAKPNAEPGRLSRVAIYLLMIH